MFRTSCTYFYLTILATKTNLNHGYTDQSSTVTMEQPTMTSKVALEFRTGQGVHDFGFVAIDCFIPTVRKFVKIYLGE